MDPPRYEYDPRDVYQWANGDRDEALSREDGLLGSTMTTSDPRSDTRAQSSRFNEHVVLTSRPFAVEANGPTPGDLAHQGDQRNFTNNNNLNVYDQYSRFGSPSLSLLIPHSNDTGVYGRLVPPPQPPPNGGEYKGPGSHSPGDYTQCRGYLASSRSTAQQQQFARPTGTGTVGPIRHDVWRVKARPYQQKVETAELARRNSSSALSVEDRRTALRTQFHAQHNATSPVSPNPSSPSFQLTSGNVPYPGDNRQPFPNTRLAPKSLDASDSVLHHHTPSQSPSTFDESRYPPTFSGGWRNPNPEHASFSQSSGGAASSSSSSEHISLSQPNLGAPVSINSAPPATSTSVGTVFIHSNLTQSSSNPRNDMQDYPEYQHFFPLQTEAHRQLRVAMHHVLNSEWKLRNELEPTSQVILQFSTRVVIDGTADGEDSGAFKYRCLLYHGGEMCNRSWARAERMLAHLRGAIDLRPFACEGAGGGCNCGMRFFAEDTLQQHRKNTRAVGCQYCGAGVTPRNIKRHLRNNCPKSPQRAHNQEPPA